MDHHHDQKEYDYDDGQRRYRMRSETHTYRSTSNVAAIESSSSSSHMDMHAQLHQQAMNNHHQLAMNSMNMMHETMRSNMQSFHSLGAPPQRRQLTYRQAFEESSSEEESSSDSSEDDRLVVTRRQNTELRTLTSQYTADRARLEQAGAGLDRRIQRLEEQESKNKAEHDAKDAELRRLREENSKLHQQRHDDGEKHRKEVADIARAHAEKPAATASALDMDALRDVVKQIQQSQLSKSDLETIIQERVASQLEGVATKKDLAAAGSNMEKALSALPSGASAAQVQKALSTELDRAVDKLASKVKPSGSTIHNNTTIMYNQATMSSAIGGSDRLLELGPDEHGGKNHKKDKKKKHRQKYIEDVPSSSSKHKSKEEPVRKAIEAASAHHDFVPLVADRSLVRTEKSHKESKSTVSVEETTSSALVKTKSSSSKHTPVGEAAHSSALVKTKSSSTKHSSTTEDKAADKSSHKESKSSSSSSHEKKDKPMKTIMPAIAEEPMSTALAKVDKKKKAEEPASSTALAKVDKKHKTEESSSSTALTKTDKRKKTEEASASTSLTKTDKKKHRDEISEIHVMEMPDLSGHSRLPAGGHEFELPDDFPENASMISTYERAQASKARGIEASSSSAPSRQIAAPPAHGSSGALAKIKKDKK